MRITDTQTTELNPRFAEGHAMRVIGLSERYGAATRDLIPKQRTRLQQRFGAVRRRTDPAKFGLWYQISEDPFELEYLTAVMVGDGAPLPVGFVERRLAPRRHAVFTHHGEPSGLRPLMQAIFHDWLPRSGHAAGGNPDFVEVYGEGLDPRLLRGAIEIWVPLQN